MVMLHQTHNAHNDSGRETASDRSSLKQHNMHNNNTHQFSKVFLTTVIALTILTAQLGILVAPGDANAVAVAPGNMGCHLFTQDTDYILGNPPAGLNLAANLWNLGHRQ